jgi:hypothetical protein
MPRAGARAGARAARAGQRAARIEVQKHKPTPANTPAKSSKKRRSQSVSQKPQFYVKPTAVSAESPPVVRRLFEVNSEPHTGARPSVRLCVGLKNTLGRLNDLKSWIGVGLQLQLFTSSSIWVIKTSSFFHVGRLWGFKRRCQALFMCVFGNPQLKLINWILLKHLWLAPHTNGPRDVPRCGALSLLQ